MERSTPHELSYAEMDEALAGIDIPPCPNTVTAVMAEAQKDSPDITVLTRIIAGDVGMSAYALKMANSVLFRRGAVTDHVGQAIARLGTRNVVCIVVAVALRNSLADALPAEFLDHFWNRSNAAALASGMVARKLRGIPADLAYTYGLFHDAAVPVMMRRFPDYGEVFDLALTQEQPLVAIEDARYRCSHAVVGALLARNWGLPATLAAAIRHHHDVGAYEMPRGSLAAESLALIAVTQVAERLISDGLGEPDHEVGALYDKAVAYLGLHEDELRDLAEDLVEALSG
ncbi:HDOD domain-containing protein [Parasulfuritortus cantonensis]|uniref:HDOD domain-containing protein n=1 Tax=Parasulfuritortus cantonensis TaxID=2528202 RepID=A0A4R1BIN8_9PROT|nr:HDOD domain-containing protein [Parasulfuritortus cantonensis]TCJ17156.1 HDOD domain-containing protein [Parasulfuritortus cantonensis]